MSVLAVEASLEAVSPVAALAAEAAEAGKSIIKTSPCVLRTCFFLFLVMQSAAIWMSGIQLTVLQLLDLLIEG